MANEDAIIKLGADVASVIKALESVQGEVKKMSEAVQKAGKQSEPVFVKLSSVLSGFFGKLTGGVAIGTFFGNKLTDIWNSIVSGVMNAVTALPALIQRIAELGDRFKTLSARTGVSVEAISQLEYVSGQTGVALETITRGIQVMSTTLGKGGSDVARALDRIHLSTEQMRKAKPEEAFIAMMAGLKEIPNAAERARVGTELFGRQFRQMSELAEEDMAAMMRTAKLMGLTITQAQADMADRFTDAQHDMKMLFEGVQRQIAFAFMPAVTAVFETLVDAVLDSFEEMGKSGVDWKETVRKTLRTVVEAIGTFIEALVPMVQMGIRSIIPLAEAFLSLGQAALQGFKMMLQAQRFVSFGPVVDELTTVINAIDGLQTAGDQLRVGLQGLKPTMEEVAKAVGKGAEGFKGKLLKAFDDINKSLEETSQKIKKKDTFVPPSEAMTAFLKTIDNLKEKLKEAAGAHLSWNETVRMFGPAASQLVEQARAIKGGIALIPPEIMKLATAFDLLQVDKLNQQLIQAIETFKQFNTQVVDTEKEALAAMDRIFNQRRENRRLFMTEEDAALDEMVQAEKDAIQAIEESNSQFKAEEIANTREEFAKRRALHKKYTGDIEKDLQLHGVKSQAIKRKELAAEIALMNEMLLARITGEAEITDAQLREIQERIKNRQDEINGVNRDWQAGLSKLAGAFAQLSQITGGSFSGFVKSVGVGIGQLNTAATSLSGAFDNKTGIGASFKGLKDSFAGKGGGLSGALSSLGNLASGIGGVIAVAGMAIDIGKKMWDAFTRSGGEDVAKRVGERMGVKISEEMGDAIWKTAKEKFKGDKFAAEVFHLSDIIKSAGGITADNFDKLLGSLRDTFSMIAEGKFTVEQATEVLDKNFGAFADHVLKSGKVASKEFTEIIRLQQQFGTQSKQIMDFVAGQTTRFGTALGKLAGAMDDNADSVARFERLAVAGFNAAIASGVPYVEAIKSIGPALDKIAEKNKKLGLAGGEAIQELLRFREVASANQDLVESAASLNEVMLALSNVGGLTTETMADLQSQGKTTFDKLIAAGFTEGQALQQMKGFLEQVRNAHKELGLPIDENTQALIGQAEAQGVLKAEQMSTNDIMIEGLSAIIEALGGKLPDAWAKAKDAALDASEKIKDGTEITEQQVLDISQKLAESEMDWKSWASTGVTAGRIAASGVGGTARAVDSVGDKLDDTEWEQWASRAQAAADIAGDAIDEVSYGSSPGGIKEIPLMLEKASRAAEEFASTMKGQMGGVSLATNAFTGAGPGAAAGAAAAAAQPEGGDTFNFSFNIQSFDAMGVEMAVERKILPGMLKVLRRGRNLKDFQDLVNS